MHARARTHTQTHTHTHSWMCKVNELSGADQCRPPFDHRVVCFLRPMTSDSCWRKVECLFSWVLMIHLTPFSCVSVWHALCVCVWERERERQSALPLSTSTNTLTTCNLSLSGTEMTADTGPGSRFYEFFRVKFDSRWTRTWRQVSRGVTRVW